MSTNTDPFPWCGECWTWHAHGKHVTLDERNLGSAYDRIKELEDKLEECKETGQRVDDQLIEAQRRLEHAENHIKDCERERDDARNRELAENMVRVEWERRLEERSTLLAEIVAWVEVARQNYDLYDGTVHDAWPLDWLRRVKEPVVEKQKFNEIVLGPCPTCGAKTGEPCDTSVPDPHRV